MVVVPGCEDIGYAPFYTTICTPKNKKPRVDRRVTRGVVTERERREKAGKVVVGLPFPGFL